MASKAKTKQAKTGNKGQFKKGDPRIQPGPGRYAGYKTWSAELYAWMLESPASKKDPRPFAIAAMEKYKQKVLSGTVGPLLDFMDGIQSFGIENLDEVLAGQKTQDKAFLRYQIYETFFDEQKQLYDCKKPRQVTVSGRRAGKTHEEAGDGVSQAVSHEDGNILYMGATHKSVMSIVWPVVVQYLKMLRIPFTQHIADQKITLPSGVEIFFAGFHTMADIEKWRGHKWRRVYIDEAQICKNLKYLLDEVIGPAMADYNGIIKIYGTPPRVRGTYFESLWNDAGQSKNMARFNWDMSVNIHMPDYEKILDKIREERGWTKENQVYQREYLGRMGIYDEDALVYRLTDNNYFTAEYLNKWIAEHPPSDLFFISGLDYGTTDFDAYGILLGSRKRPEMFLVYEYKKRGNGVTELVEGIRAGYDYIAKTFPQIPQSCYIYADTAGQKISVELRNTYKLPVNDAIKANKDFGIQMLQDDVRRGYLKVMKGGHFDEEAKFVVFKRNEVDDTLTREVDDDVYHGDMTDAVLYGKRPLYKVGTTQK